MSCRFLMHLTRPYQDMSQSVTLNSSSILGFRRPFTTETKCALTITNNDQQSMAFIVKTTAPKLYCVRPNRGRIEPGKSINLIVIKSALKDEPPRDTKCKDKFLVQWTTIISGERDITVNDIWTDRKRDNGHNVFQQKLGIKYLDADAPVPYSIFDNAFISRASILDISPRGSKGTIHPSTKSKLEQIVSFSPKDILEFRGPRTVSLQSLFTIRNNTERPVAFAVKTTAQELYWVQPNVGRVEPWASIDVLVWNQPQKESKELPLHTKCNDKFLIKSISITPDMEGIAINDIWSMPNINEKQKVFEKRLRVAYFPEPQMSISANIPGPSLRKSSQEILQDKQNAPRSLLANKLVALSPSHNLAFRRPLTEIRECLLTITNKQDEPVAFKVQTKTPKLYCVKPNSGRLEPGESIVLSVTLQPMKEEPQPGIVCKDKFRILSTVITPEKRNIILQDIWASPDIQEQVQIIRQKLGVIYLPAEEQAEDKMDNNTRVTFSRFRKWIHNRMHSTGGVSRP